MRRGIPLSARSVETVKEPGSYGDGRGGYGLSLFVERRANGRLSKTWRQRVRIDGKPINLGLGTYPIVTLKEAREKALANRRTIEQGIDPRKGRGKGEVGVPTFAEAAEKVIDLRRPAWKPGSGSEQQWRASLRDYAMPTMGRKPVDKITTADVLAALTPVWHKHPVAVGRVLQRIETIIDWAIAQGYRDNNPAGAAIRKALPNHNGTPKQQPALPHAEVAAALATVRASEARPVVKLALEFVALTASRPGMVVGARWDEIDGETWTIPGSRMKRDREHRVPLSERALEVLAEARELAGDSDLVFPNEAGKALTTKALTRVHARLAIPAVPHGYRSSFRTWAAERGVDPAVAEAAIAHSERDRVVAAYQRSDYLEQRRRLMQDWADYLRTD